jgi:hypothetical protein
VGGGQNWGQPPMNPSRAMGSGGGPGIPARARAEQGTVVTSETRHCWDSRLATSMQSVDALQEVQVLPRATASHQPGSKTRWREATNVRSRVEQVSRGGIEPRKLCASRGPARHNHPRTPAPWGWEPRTVSVRWNAVSALSLAARQGRGHRGRRPDHAGKGEHGDS